MPVKIQAEVINIRTDTPTANEQFFVDTNVWVWVGYTKASLSSKPYQINTYPDYTGKVLSAGARLHKCTLSFSELAHVIERSEWGIYKNTSGNTDLKPKDFRQNYPQQRTDILAEIESSWQLAEAMTENSSIAVTIDEQAITAAFERLSTQALDGYDAFMIDAILKQDITKVITDDGDFGQIPGIQVFTANDWLIRQAKRQNKLRKR